MLENINELRKRIEEIEYYRYPLPLFHWASRGWRISNFSGSPDLQVVKTRMSDEASEKWWKILSLPFFFFLIALLLRFNYPRLSLLIIYYASPIALMLFLLNIFYILPRTMNGIARENDEKLKGIAQNAIRELVEYFKEHNINPKKFPLELRHDDYQGLIYEKEEKKLLWGKLYTAYLDLEKM
jgi:hypothetical protein